MHIRLLGMVKPGSNVVFIEGFKEAVFSGVDTDPVRSDGSTTKTNPEMLLKYPTTLVHLEMIDNCTNPWPEL